MSELPFSRLPGMNALFLDFVQNPEKLSAFYPSRDRLRSASIPHRKELCSILKNQNEKYGNPNTGALIEKLASNDCRCVITGQQVGLLTGPMYTMWKGLSAVKKAQQLEDAHHTSFIPIFWMATEDHNWHEVMNFALLKEDLELLPFSLKEHFFLKKQPTGTISVGHPEVRKILLRAFQQIKIPRIKEFYSDGNLAIAFARTLLWLLKDYPILIIDPSDPQLKQLAAPFFQRFFEQKNQLLKGLNAQNELLKKSNYPAQVKMEENQLPLFIVDGDERRHVPASANLKEIPIEQLSPSALLRPIFQDYLFPTAAYIGGPAEIAYFAQLHPWYKALNVEQPWVLPRASVTLLPPAVVRFLKSQNLSPEELYLKEDTLIDALINHGELEEMRKSARELADLVQQRIAAIQTRAEKVDTTLVPAIRTAANKMNYQMQKVERKAFLALKRKNQNLLDRIRKARNVIYPDEKLQERYLNIFSFSTLLPDLIRQIYPLINVDSAAHQRIEI